MDKKEQVKWLLRQYDAKLYDIWVQNPDTTEKMFAKEEGVQNWLIQQLNTLYQPEEQQSKPEMVVCPKAGECKISCFCINHSIEHEEEESCQTTSAYCPACIPVSPPEPVKPDEGLLLTNVIEELAEQLWRTYSHLVTYHALSYGEEPATRKAEWRREASSIYGQLKCQQHYEVEKAVLLKANRDHQKQVEELQARIKELEKDLKGQEHDCDCLDCAKDLVAQAKAEAYKEIGEWMENETRGVNFGAWAYWWQTTIKLLKSGTLPLEGKG